MNEENKKKILIVEDDTTISSMYKTKLEAEGFMVVAAEDGGSGLEAAKKVDPDIILLDVIMPGLDGFSVLEGIRKEKKLNKTIVVMLTNLGTEEDQEKGKRMGANDYLVKSDLTPSDVSKKVKELLAAV